MPLPESGTSNSPLFELPSAFYGNTGIPFPGSRIAPSPGPFRKNESPPLRQTSAGQETAACGEGTRNLPSYLRCLTNSSCFQAADGIDSPRYFPRGISSVGRASRLHPACRRCESLITHHLIPLKSNRPLVLLTIVPFLVPTAVPEWGIQWQGKLGI